LSKRGMSASSLLSEQHACGIYGNCRIMDTWYNPRSSPNYGNPYLFTGRRVDILDSSSLKIQYNRNRYYDYYTGRWLTHDPLGITPNARRSTWFNTLAQNNNLLGFDDYATGRYLMDNPSSITAYELGVPEFDPLYQYEEVIDLYEYGASDPTNQLDPFGKACLVTYKCLYESESIYKKCIKFCRYICVEDKTIKRRNLWGIGGANCKDPAIPTVIRHSYPTAWFRTCSLTVKKNKMWDYLQWDPKDGSEKECIKNAEDWGKRKRKWCNVLLSTKPKEKEICLTTAHLIEAAWIASCGLCERK